MELQAEHRRTRKNGRKTRQRLLASAVSLWSQHGQLGVTVSAVAEHAGTTRRTVYHHFAAQETLVEETERYVKTQLEELADGNSGDLAQPYRLVAGLAADNPDLIRSVLLGMLQEDPRENTFFQNCMRFWSSPDVKECLAADIPADHATAITLAMWFAGTLVVSAKDPAKRTEEADRFAATFKTLLHSGLVTKPLPSSDR